MIILVGTGIPGTVKKTQGISEKVRNHCCWFTVIHPFFGIREIDIIFNSYSHSFRAIKTPTSRNRNFTSLNLTGDFFFAPTVPLHSNSKHWRGDPLRDCWGEVSGPKISIMYDSKIPPHYRTNFSGAKAVHKKNIHGGLIINQYRIPYEDPNLTFFESQLHPLRIHCLKNPLP